MKLVKYLLLPAILSAGLICSSEAQTAGDIKVHNGEKIAFLGDSITQFGWERAGGYVKLVIAGLQSVGVTAVPVPAGISGNTSRDMLGRLDRDVISKKPDWMTLSCGVNDVWHGANGVDLETYKTNIASIVDKAQAAGIKVVILTATMIMENDNPFNQKLAAYNDFLRQLAKDKGLPLVDLNAQFWDVLKAPPAEGSGPVHLTVDGVHMNPQGNMLMARGILEGFGVTPAQVDAYETTWKASPDAAPALGAFSTNTRTGISLDAYNALNKIAVERKVSPVQLQNDLCFAALRAVMKNHEQDATLLSTQIQAELDQEFGRQVEALVKEGK